MATAAERRAARAAARAAAEGKVGVKGAAGGSGETKTEAKVETHSEAPPAPRSRNTVTVACKLPNGLILQNYTLIDGLEPVFGGGSRPIKVSQAIGGQIKINGSARAINSDPDAKRVVGGYGLTFNVPKDEFEQWMRDNKELDLVKNHLIFAHESSDRAADQARDMKGFRSGLEPLNTESKKADGTYADPRMLKNVKRFKPDDDTTDIRGT